MVLIVVCSFTLLANVNSTCSKLFCWVQVVGVDETVCVNWEWLVVGVSVCGVANVLDPYVVNGTPSYGDINSSNTARI